MTMTTESAPFPPLAQTSTPAAQKSAAKPSSRSDATAVEIPVVVHASRHSSGGSRAQLTPVSSAARGNAHRNCFSGRRSGAPFGQRHGRPVGSAYQSAERRRCPVSSRECQSAGRHSELRRSRVHATRSWFLGRFFQIGTPRSHRKSAACADAAGPCAECSRPQSRAVPTGNFASRAGGGTRVAGCNDASACSCFHASNFSHPLGGS